MRSNKILCQREIREYFLEGLPEQIYRQEKMRNFIAHQEGILSWVLNGKRLPQGVVYNN